MSVAGGSTPLEDSLAAYAGAARRRGNAPAEESLAGLRQFLEDYIGLEEVAEVRSGHLLEFLLEWAPSRFTLSAQEHMELLRLARGWAEWLCAQGPSQLDPALDVLRRLEGDLTRCHRLVELLDEMLQAGRLGEEIIGVGEESQAPLGIISAGAQNLIDLSRVDEAAAEMEYFVVSRVEGGAVYVDSEHRRALGEPELGPVLLPPGAAELVRPGDILNFEIAPTAEGWVPLHVECVTPGGYL